MADATDVYQLNQPSDTAFSASTTIAQPSALPYMPCFSSPELIRLGCSRTLFPGCHAECGGTA